MPQAQHRRDVDWAENIQDLAMVKLFESWEDSDIIIGSERTKVDRANIAKKYGEFVQIQYPTAAGHEWSWGEDGSEFMNRWRSFFFHRVACSKGKKSKLMTYSSMVRLRWDCLFLMIEFTDSSGTERATTMARTTFLWVKQAQHNFKLDTELTVKSYFGPDEVKLLIAGAMMDAVCYDNSLQHTIAIILELETGIRPSSAFAVRNYRDCYIRFKNIKIFRDADSPGRFASELTIEWWKGYHDTSRLRIVYMLRSTTVAEHLDLDIGCYLVAHGIRRGLFKHHSTLESLLAGTEHWIQYKDEILEDAFFVQSTKRGLGIDPTKPMRDNNHREFMQRIGISVGLGGSESGVTSYAMRRNFATVIANRAGKDKARKAMAHKANSTTLETTYDDDIRRTDFVGLILGESSKWKASMITTSPQVFSKKYTS